MPACVTFKTFDVGTGQPWRRASLERRHAQRLAHHPAGGLCADVLSRSDGLAANAAVLTRQDLNTLADLPGAD